MLGELEESARGKRARLPSARALSQLPPPQRAQPRSGIARRAAHSPAKFPSSPARDLEGREARPNRARTCTDACYLPLYCPSDRAVHLVLRLNTRVTPIMLWGPRGTCP
ncbi:hypothetical protein BD413DRAFT_247996 [Trametes elegans]|nr:hypothetical protein BD413DRAFT_247996 [Trametes elegans]